MNKDAAQHLLILAHDYFNTATIVNAGSTDSGWVVEVFHDAIRQYRQINEGSDGEYFVVAHPEYGRHRRLTDLLETIKKELFPR